MRKDYTKDLQSLGVTPDLIEKSLSESFESLLDASFSNTSPVEGSVVKGIIVDIDGDTATVDIGMKAEGRISLREFAEATNSSVELAVGDEVEVFVKTLTPAAAKPAFPARKHAAKKRWTRWSRRLTVSKPLKVLFLAALKAVSRWM